MLVATEHDIFGVCFLPLYYALCCCISKDIKKAGPKSCLCTSVILKQVQNDKGKVLLFIDKFRMEIRVRVDVSHGRSICR